MFRLRVSLCLLLLGLTFFLIFFKLPLSYSLFGFLLSGIWVIYWATNKRIPLPKKAFSRVEVFLFCAYSLALGFAYPKLELEGVSIHLESLMLILSLFLVVLRPKERERREHARTL